MKSKPLNKPLFFNFEIFDPPIIFSSLFFRISLFEGTIESFSFNIPGFRLFTPSNKSMLVVIVSVFLSKFRYVETLPCGSKSMINVL